MPVFRGTEREHVRATVKMGFQMIGTDTKIKNDTLDRVTQTICTDSCLNSSSFSNAETSSMLDGIKLRMMAMSDIRKKNIRERNNVEGFRPL